MLNCRIIHCESVINVQSKEDGATIFGLAMKFGLSRATRKKLKFGSKNSERVKQKTNKKKKRDELMNIKSLSVKSWHDGCPNKVPQCDSITDGLIPVHTLDAYAWITNSWLITVIIR